MTPVHQKLITVARENLELQTVGCALFGEIVAVFRTKTDQPNLSVAVDQPLKRLPGVTLPNHGVQALLGRKQSEIIRHRAEYRRRAGNTYAQTVGHRIARAQCVDGFHFAQNAPRVLQKDCAALRRTDTFAGAFKDCETNRFFHVAQNTAQVRLPDKEIFGRLRNRAGSLNLDDILKVLCIHNGSSRMRFSAKMPYHQLYRAGDGFGIKIGYVRERTSAHTHRSAKFIIQRQHRFFKSGKKACIWKRHRL